MLRHYYLFFPGIVRFPPNKTSFFSRKKCRISVLLVYYLNCLDNISGHILSFFYTTFFLSSFRLISDATVEKDESHPGKVSTSTNTSILSPYCGGGIRWYFCNVLLYEILSKSRDLKKNPLTLTRFRGLLQKYVEKNFSRIFDSASTIR